VAVLSIPIAQVNVDVDNPPLGGVPGNARMVRANRVIDPRKKAEPPDIWAQVKRPMLKTESGGATLIQGSSSTR
jgi:hypothetical protein